MSGLSSSGGSAAAAAGAPPAAPPVPFIAAPSANRPLSQTLVWLPPSKSASGCPHVVDWIAKTPSWKQVYGTVLSYVNTQHLQKRWGKVIIERPACCGCGEGVQKRLLVSLHSVFVGCAEKGCFKEHSKSTGNNLSVDLDRGELFCMACNDYIYDSNLELVRLHTKEQMKEGGAKSDRGASNGAAGKHLGDDEPALKRPRGDGSVQTSSGGGVSRLCIPKRDEWLPTAEQVKQIQEHAQGPENNEVVGGLRGFYNVGNTCFLNCVLQGLVHNPSLRDYFLGDYHNRHRCQHKREAESKQETICMGCEMDRLINDFFQPHKQAYTPHHFLYCMWKSSQHLAGYEQQDAHECFISVLTALQTCCEDDVDGRAGMIQHLFGGCMRSDVTCLGCKTASVTRDPFVDISLDLKSHTAAVRDIVVFQTNESSSAVSRPQSSPQDSATMASVQVIKDSAAGDKASDVDGGHVGSLAKVMWEGAFNKGDGTDRGEMSKSPSSQGNTSGSSQPANSAGTTADSVPVPTVSLKQCLKWFTRVEKLDAKGYKCDGCSSYQEGLKQLSIQTLAPSLCLQLKRFESLRNGGHNGGQQSFKVDTHVVFPAWLNMAPYLSDGRPTSGGDIAVGNGEKSSVAGNVEGDGDDDDDASGRDPIWYHLYAVVVHHGKLDSGHYTSFVRRGGDWFRCDDAAVVLVPEEEVLSSQAYLLLYTFAS